ncbi:family 20 glycosylhydrolase, partial [Streptomyces sp. NPDC051976]|uniref:family 20 glycosylhydrolase n=1 Tax=Streptomyces sp. NPDC051976 TaxID=3154947 RepID=UPI00343A77BD
MAAAALAGGATTASAADPSTPAVVPALQNWSPTSGSLTLGPTTRVNTDAASQPTATLLVGELSSVRGWATPVATDAPRLGDIVLRTDTSRDDLGPEGYALSVGSQLTITGNSNAGVFYGTRTLLQLLAQSTAIPDGHTTDVPTYGERAIGVDPMYTYNTDAWFTRLIKDMAYLKLNTLHLELKVKNDQYPAVNTFSYYTPSEVRSLIALAANYHITVIPEINAPGHIDPYLAPYPDLQLKDRSGTPDPTRLDITNADAFTFYTHLIDSDLSVFTGPYFHMGADEYMINSAYSNYPQIQEYARAKFGANATPQDAYIDFINRVDTYVRSKGRTLRIWNDGLTGANTVPLNKDIVVEYWSRAAVASQQLLNDGYQVMNASGSWYYTRGSYQPNAQALYNSGWNPLDFIDQTVSNTGNRITGAEYNVWPDHYDAENENQVQQGMFTSMRAFAQGVWGSPNPTADYTGFTALAASIGHAPGYGAPWTQPLSGGSYTITNAGGQLAETDSTGAPLTTSGTAATTWHLLPTSDGYYRLQNGDSGRCADIRPSTANQANPLGVVEQAGASATAEWCTGTETQKWQIEPVTGGYSIVNATTQEALQPAGTTQLVVQQPRDAASNDVWSFTASSESGPITGYGGKCVDIAGAATANGTAIQLYVCNGTTA